MADVIVSSSSNWSECKSGGAPAAGDSLYLQDGVTLTLDGANDSLYTCALIRACVSASNTTTTTGIIALQNATSRIAANLHAGKTNHLLTVATGKTVTMQSGTTVTGGDTNAVRVTGGTCTVITAVGGNNTSGVTITSGTLTVTNANGSPDYAGGIGVTVAGGTATITNANGGSKSNANGVTTYGTCTVTTATGGSATGAHGVNVTGGTLTVSSAVGGSHASAAGVYFSAATITVTATTEGTGPGFSQGTTKLGTSPIVTAKNSDGSANVQLIRADTVAAAADVRSGTPRYTGGTNGTMSTGVIVIED